MTSMTIYKQCKTCFKNFEATLENFYKATQSKDKLEGTCKECAKIKKAKYREENIEKIRHMNWLYDNSEIGFITNCIGGIFKPSNIKKRGLYPNINKEKLKEFIFKFIEKNGRICQYCGITWTYKRSKSQGEKKCETNFSIDRLDNTVTYQEDNIVLCCAKCNDSKHSITFEIIDSIQRIRKEKNLI